MTPSGFPRLGALNRIQDRRLGALDSLAELNPGLVAADLPLRGPNSDSLPSSEDVGLLIT